MDGLSMPPSPMQALQADHERLLGRLDDVGGGPCPGNSPQLDESQSFELQALIQEARAYIVRSKDEAEWIHDARDRSQLRANLRFWAAFLVNCTGIYPNTTLRPARPFSAEYPGFPMAQPAGSGASGMGVKRTSTGEPTAALEPAEAQGQVNGDDFSDQDGEQEKGRSSWPTRLSRSLGLVVTLLVGVIPLAAVCLALSLFYNLDNRSPWGSAGEAATQTAIAAAQLPRPTILPLITAAPNLERTTPSDELLYLMTKISTGGAAPASCTPGLLLSFDSPKSIDNQSMPAVEVAVYPAGTETAMANVTLEPGASPFELSLQNPSQATAEQDWLVQAEHPWAGVESVILSGALFQDCAQDQVTIVYQAPPGADIWQPASQAGSPSDLDLSWGLLTWGPQALDEEKWMASLTLQASGGNGQYVYFANGDLATRDVGDILLSDGRFVLEQAHCRTALAQVGVTSAGKSFKRALPLQLFTPECR